MSEISVKKRNGKKENYNIEKIHRVLNWATEGLSNISISDIALHAKPNLYNGVSTTEIHNSLIKSASDLISLDEPNYQWVAARLLNYKIRKDVWGSKEPPRLLDLVKDNVKKKIYTKEILDFYTEGEINKLGAYIKHDRDNNFTYAGIQQMVDKYLVKNRLSNELYETPQFAYMLIGMVLFAQYQEENRVRFVKTAYDYFSTFKISLPTPIMAGVRTLIKQFSSCVLVDIDDSLNSIFASASAIGHYSSKRAGIGLNVGRIRAINSPIRGGEVVHTGVVPYLKLMESAVKSTQQNGIRGASGTAHCPWWHYEVDDVIVLKNNAGTDDNRVRKLDYSIQFCGLFYKRLINKENITLFCPHEAKGLYDAFGTDKFEELYEKYENDKSIKRRRVIPSTKIAALFARERLETGRIYAMNIDHCNNCSSWKIPIKMSNLCQEVLTPTLPTDSLEDEGAEIGICTLSAVNMVEVKNDDEHESICEIIVRLLDSLLDYQDYPVKAGENFSINRRSLGVSATNLAAYLAKNKTLYSDDSSIDLIDEFMEKQQYFLLKASNKLAKECGACEKYHETKYSKGLLPIDWSYEGAKKLTKRKLVMDWKSLRDDIKKHGLRNSTLSCQAPIESSSVVQNSTNGIEPIRNLLMQKKSKMGVLKQLPPSYPKYKNYYQLAYSIKDNKYINNIAGTICKWVDMATSTNHWYNYSDFDNGIIPLSVVIKDMIDAYNKGVKTLYYANSDDGDNDATIACEGGACSV